MSAVRQETGQEAEEIWSLGAACALPKASEERQLAACEGVIDLAAALFNVSGKDLRRAGRSNLNVSRVRQVAMYVSHVTLCLTMREVGVGFGRDRTTVLHACHLVEDLRDDPDFDGVVAMFERVVRAAFKVEI